MHVYFFFRSPEQKRMAQPGKLMQAFRRAGLVVTLEEDGVLRVVDPKGSLDPDKFPPELKRQVDARCAVFCTHFDQIREHLQEHPNR